MRDWSGPFLCVVLAVSSGLATVVVGACGSTPAITVVRTTAQDKAEEVKGDPVKLKHGEQEPYSGARGGFYVIRNNEDWKGAWPSGQSPPLPPALDTRSFMAFLAVAESQDVTQVKIRRAVETSEILYVWARETKVGEGCQNKSTERAFDAVVTPRADKPVKFFVDEERGESCGQPPEAKVMCRLKDQTNWSPKVEAQPGDKVECELTATAHGKFELIDRALSIELPGGSTAKLAFPKGPLRGELSLDVYGSYTVRGEAADEGGRHGKAWATIDVHPPKSDDVLVQLVWAGFDRNDDPDTFPRVNLRVAEEGPKAQRCSADIPVPGLCEVKTRGPYTYMRIPAGNRHLPVSVQFLDERAEKGPGPCVHIWFDGARTGEICDHAHHSADDIWQLGTLDTTTGKLETQAADGGAPRTGDAGTKKPAAKPAAKPVPAPKKK